MKAVGYLLNQDTDFSLTDAATAAGVSTATAYRHFNSVEDAVGDYTAGFLTEVHDKIALRQKGGRPLSLEAVCKIWVESVLSWGKPLVRLRSAKGFMQRLFDGDDDIMRETEVFATQLAQLLGATSLDDQRLCYAIMAWNSLADPREVIDQHETLGWDVATITRRLHTAVMAIVRELAWESHLEGAGSGPRR